ncbi:phenylalanine--tRNA ligase beta subunit-related protein, partial [Staphylococcus aureus]
YYSARAVHDATIELSPLWMQARSIIAGIRPCINAVDLAYYELFEHDQPLHILNQDAFAYQQIVFHQAN